MTKLTFEKALEQLEHIVQEMESGDLPLDKALKKFEEGIKLSQFCTAKLDETEKKITLLMAQADGSVTQTPFDAGSDNSTE